MNDKHVFVLCDKALLLPSDTSAQASDLNVSVKITVMLMRIDSDYVKSNG